MSYALDEISWIRAAEALEARPALILPVGALEQHGPHLPLGANVIIAERVAREVSERVGVLRAPTFSYGVNFGGGPFALRRPGPFGGPAGLTRKTLHRAVNELLADWEDHGVRHFFIVTAHRYEPHLEALLMTLTTKAEKSVFDLYEIDVRDLLSEEPEAEHGGELETSLVLHLTPELVRTEEIEDFLPGDRALRRYHRRRVPKPPKTSRGAIGVATAATAAKGALVFERWVSAIADVISSDLDGEA